MIQLKNYQQDALDTLSLYFDKVSEKYDPKIAFIETVYERFNGDDSRRYLPIKNFNSTMPYVCLRVPTGGGKTLMACHSIRIAKDRLLKQEHALVLWLVPTNTIRTQTLAALKNREHPYRQALSSSLGEIEVKDITECLDISKGALDGATTIVVATMASGRRANTEGLNLYKGNGSLMSHFSGIEQSILDKLDKNENGVIEYSLANVFKMRHPIVVVDEAHNARTGLSFETLARFSPSAIIEFTATPSNGTRGDKIPSNVLHHVSARELQAENMIKLPVKLEINGNWKELLAHSISERNTLEQIATLEGIKTGEYIRPIMLIKAQNRKIARPENITVDVAKKYLIEECNIPENQIAIEAYDKSETTGVDLFSDTCKIRYIITVDKLGEGWDCSFAYVLCSLSEQFSETAVEQIIGRVLRLPHTSPKSNPALNCAYVYTVSRNFAEAANSLKDALVESGFNAMEAEDFVQKQTQSNFDFGKPIPSKVVSLKKPLDNEKISESVKGKVKYNPETNIITVEKVLSEKDESELLEAATSEEDKQSIKEAIAIHRQETEKLFEYPEDKQIKFRVPLLGVVMQGEFVLLEKGTSFLENNWNICDYINASENFNFDPKEIKNKRAEIDLNDNGKLSISIIEEAQQDLALLESEKDWDETKLISWLDRNISHTDILPKDSVAFISHVLFESSRLHSASLTDFVRERFSFLKFLRKLFDDHRNTSAEKHFQQQLELYIQDKSLEIGDDEHSVSFESNVYPVRVPYNPIIPFSKHYYKNVGDFDDIEESDCAQFIDQLEDVDFWVRNLSRGENSFWLPRAKGKFYPDFVLKLKDGRIFAIEYKGADRVTNDDSKEKKVIGNLWAERSNGKCLFLMAEKDTYKTEILRLIKGNIKCEL